MNCCGGETTVREPTPVPEPVVEPEKPVVRGPSEWYYGADVKVIHLIINGDDSSLPKLFAFTSRQIRSYEYLLEEITDLLRPKKGYVERLYTATSGTLIRGLEKLKTGRVYVAVGPHETFKLCNYQLQHDSKWKIKEPFKVPNTRTQYATSKMVDLTKVTIPS